MGKMFQKSIRQKLKLRLAIDGPSGSGKTYTALRIAMKLGEHYKTQVAVIETEHKSASKYIGECPDGVPFDFDDCNLDTFSPTEYTSRIEGAEREGYGVLVIDSLSHAWDGKDGALELVDKKGGGNKFTGWKDVTPMHRRMIEAILASKCHVICTMRSKTEYVMEETTNKQGQTVTVPRKVALAPIQRAGMEYEFDVYGSMDWSNTMTITKSRCSAINGLIAVKPGAALAESLISWLETGEAAVDTGEARLLRIDDEKLLELTKLIAAAGIKPDDLKRDLLKYFQIERLADLSPSQAQSFIVRKRLGKGPAKAAAPAVPNGTRNTSADVAADAAAPAQGVDEGEGGDESDEGAANNVQVGAVLANTMANPAKHAASNSPYQSPDDPVCKATLASLNRAIARLVKAGHPQELITKGIAKRNPRATCPADLTQAQAEDLEAAILKRLDGPHENPQ